MRALEDTRNLSSPKLVWLVAILAAAAVMLAPATAFGEEEAVVVCDPATEECVTATAVLEAITEDPATGVSEEPVISEGPVIIQETPAPVGPPTPRIELAPEEPVLVVAEPVDVSPVAVEAPPVSPPDLAATAAPDTPAAPFVASTSAPDKPAVVQKPDVAPAVTTIPDYAKPLADAVPAALVAKVATEAAKSVAVTPKKPQFDIGAFTKTPDSAGRFVEGLGSTVNAAGEETAGLLGPASLTVEEVFTATTEWIRPAVAEPRNLLEVLATYLVPGEGGSYTATLAALIQLAFVLVIWGLLRPRSVSSPIAGVRSSRAAGYRAVVFRPG
ncbi:MAG: hypothetical protein OEM67_03610 [Thermoleophilia bacterium]|nr:hypothetical protein [Thermoleophilia bacterium]